MVMAVGMALTMAPATESIMGSLPLAKAGVGSAVNDTTRQVGGALGVAIVGSVLVVDLRHRRSPTPFAGHAECREASVERGLEGLARRSRSRSPSSIGGPAGRGSSRRRGRRSSTACTPGSSSAAGAPLVGAIVALVWLPAAPPGRAGDIEAEYEAEDAGRARRGGADARRRDAS